MPTAKQPHLIIENKPADTHADPLAHLHRPLTKEDIDKVRNIEGFPIGTDEDIIALSDPPYYTACPNPFLEDFIRAYGKPYDEAKDTYHREPFAGDVSEGKNDPIYNAHSYHTKVPHKAIMRYILHYTEPGDIVFDGFCGTGMSGVAAQLCGKPDADFKKQIETVMPNAKWGARRAILCDLSPAATFIAANINRPPDSSKFQRAAKELLAEVEAECGWMYETIHSDGKTKGHMNFTVWSDVLVCPECGTAQTFWDLGVDQETRYRKRKDEDLVCLSCKGANPLGNFQRRKTHTYDLYLREEIEHATSEAVLLSYQTPLGRFEKKLDPSDIRLLKQIEQQRSNYWIPLDRMPEGDEARRNDSLGFTHVHHFFTTRSLLNLACAWNKARETVPALRNSLLFWLTSILLGQSRLNRYLEASFSQVNRYLKGTLYIAPFTAEPSLRYAASGKIARIGQLASQVPGRGVIIDTRSSTVQALLPNSVDYVFVDPPFGSNIWYSDLNFLWESWLRVKTNRKKEAVISSSQQKLLLDYQDLMESCFAQFYAALKPGHWMTVEFHNSKNAVWNAILEAVGRAGFVVADVRVLDKQQLTMQQMTSATSVKQDLIISAYKPRGSFQQRFLQEAGTAQGAWDFVRQHLSQLPLVVETKGALETIAERQNYLLFDRMVAFHIQRGASVPLSAAEFYTGLRQRFPERDSMYFTPEQVAEYDSRRAQAVGVEQLALFVSDEKSAVQWLRTQLERERQTYQDIQPKFLRELHQARHEQMPELSRLLEENFIRDDQDRWYVPDPARAEDLEKLRERGLLKEFEAYVAAKGRLKTFRTEAVRAGFKTAWAKRDYNTIVYVSRRLPEDVLQEDPALLMYYDNAVTRSSG